MQQVDHHTVGSTPTIVARSVNSPLQAKPPIHQHSPLLPPISDCQQSPCSATSSRLPKALSSRWPARSTVPKRPCRSTAKWLHLLPIRRLPASHKTVRRPRLPCTHSMGSSESALSSPCVHHPCGPPRRQHRPSQRPSSHRRALRPTIGCTRCDTNSYKTSRRPPSPMTLS